MLRVTNPARAEACKTGLTCAIQPVSQPAFLQAVPASWHGFQVHHLDLSRWQHHHRFTPDRSKAETSTRRVMYLCMIVMLVEIIAGSCFNSMAVIADGFHMGTHVTAFLITALAYRFARRHAEDPWFSFGTGKVGVLGGFTSAIILGFVALLIAYESILHLFRSEPIHFTEAMAVATLGLAVNIASALLLREDHDHGHHRHGAGHEHPGWPGGHRHEQGHDLNFRAAYVHVLTDAAISVLAILGLGAGKFLGWIWLDPVMGLVGAGVVAQWAYVLARQTGGLLLDQTPPTDLLDEIRTAVESDGDSAVADLHVWCVGENQFTAIVSVVAAGQRTPDEYKVRLQEHAELVHVTVEVNRCDELVHTTQTDSARDPVP